MKRIKANILTTLFIVALAFQLIPTTALAGDWILYEKNGWTIGPEKVTLAWIRDITNREDKAGAVASFVQWKDINLLDIGVIGNYDAEGFRLDDADFWGGISYDITLKQISKNLSATFGLYLNPGILDKHPEAWGFYFGGSWSFGKKD